MTARTKLAADHVAAADLSHAPWHKAADPNVIGLVVLLRRRAKICRPDHRPPGLVMLVDDGIVWHIDPHHDFGVGVLWHSHAIVTILASRSASSRTWPSAFEQQGRALQVESRLHQRRC